MPKSQFVDPAKAFESGAIHFEDIPVCQYNKTLKEELKIYTKEDMMRIYRDMAIIREFETMLNEVKTKNGNNYKYTCRKPHIKVVIKNVRVVCACNHRSPRSLGKLNA